MDHPATKNKRSRLESTSTKIKCTTLW